MPIKKVPSAKYLVGILGENLNLEEHIYNLNKTIIKTAISFKIVKYLVHQENEIPLYYAYFYSMTQYSMEVYGIANSTVMKQ